MKLRNKLTKIILVLFIPLVFLMVGSLTLEDYGFNWDEPYHFIRGQMYLHFFLTGEKDYSSLPVYPRLSDLCTDWAENCGASPGGATDVLYSDGKGPIYEEAVEIYQKDKKTKRSYYQNDNYVYDEIIALEGGHPPTGGILAALTNYVFYQKLGIMGDLESHHFFEVFSAFLIVLGVAYILYKEFGIFASIVGSFSLSSYPLFFSESHFNIKDPSLASFFGLTIILFYYGVKKRKIALLFISAIFLGLATGIKFNTAFLPLIIGPWLLFYLVKKYLKAKTKIEKIKYIKGLTPTLIAIILLPLVAFLVFYALWPFLWSDLVGNLTKTLGYYREIGVGLSAEMSRYLIFGWNTYPIRWIIYTTPIPILVLSVVGIIRSTFKLLKGDDFSLLILLWFFVPILRVSWPDMVIYGGVRQIMEYIPAMAILAGIGAYSIVHFINKSAGKRRLLSKYISIFIVASLVFVVYEMVKIHPNQNVYFNQLIGGLSGARDKNIPSWGNTYGNVYLQGVEWINENVEPNAKLGLAISTMGNIPHQKLRADIQFYNRYYSGLNREGEYEIEMDFEWWPKKWYSFQYLDVFLEPVYIASVDGVPLLKVWKNDLEHTREGFEKERVYSAKSIDHSQNKILVDLGREILLTSIKVEHSSWDCEPLKGGYVAVSLDNTKWEYETDPMAAQVPHVLEEFDEDTFVFLFPARKSRYVLIDPLSTNSCLTRAPRIEIKGLERLP